MLTFGQNLWSALNGKKTFIGSFLAAVYFFAYTHNFVAYDQSIVDALQVIFGVGVTHKAVKYVNKSS